MDWVIAFKSSGFLELTYLVAPSFADSSRFLSLDDLFASHGTSPLDTQMRKRKTEWRGRPFVNSTQVYDLLKEQMNKGRKGSERGHSPRCDIKSHIHGSASSHSTHAQTPHFGSPTFPFSSFSHQAIDPFVFLPPSPTLSTSLLSLHTWFIQVLRLPPEGCTAL